MPDISYDLFVSLMIKFCNIYHFSLTHIYTQLNFIALTYMNVFCSVLGHFNGRFLVHYVMLCDSMYLCINVCRKFAYVSRYRGTFAYIENKILNVL
jgi:hypothetical protein